MNQIHRARVRACMKDLGTYGHGRYDLTVGPHKDQKFGSPRAIKLAVITVAALLCAVVGVMVITSLLSVPGNGNDGDGTAPRFANLNEMNPVRESGDNPSANEREGGSDQNRQMARNNSGNQTAAGQGGGQNGQQDQGSQENSQRGQQDGTQNQGANDNAQSSSEQNSSSNGGQEQTQEERLLEDLRQQQKMQEQREKILQEQRDAIPSPIGEQPPKPVDPMQ